ncbi:unnamed protein product [Cuscuta campestris]|uniref:Uncharacterized protein n=1 Tax=Cuscuta campestris TaxID=132261 RepID=A0A484MYW7_9ASTE|nr:unnamed protein product [Cuscuta campestris]
MNLRIVFNYERKLYIIETDPPKTPDANARASELTSFKKYEDDARDVKSAHTLNRVPSKAIESTPYELWRGRKPSFSYFKIWGCEAYVKCLMTASKLEPKSDKVIFVGYPKETRGYEFYHPSDNKIFVARNGTFLEKEFLSVIISGRKVDLEEIREPQEEIPIVLEPEKRDQAIEPQIAQDIPRRSDRIRNPPVRYGFLMSDEGDVLLKVSGSVIVFLILYVDDILLMGNDIPALTSVKTWLSENFSMKDLGNASYVLGIRIYRDRSTKLIGLNQSTYIDKILDRFSMSNSKKGSLPMTPGTVLSKSQIPFTPEQKELMMKVPYASAIGSIMEVRLSCAYYSGPVQEPLGSNGFSSGGLCIHSSAFAERVVVFATHRPQVIDTDEVTGGSHDSCRKLPRKVE